MIFIKDFIPRPYQEEIAKTSSSHNTLICLPTGMGKTKIAVIVAVQRLNLFPDSQILIVSPTKPLSHQIAEEFRKYTTATQVSLLTGSVSPSQRIEMYADSSIIVATPQTIQKDLESKRISLENFSLLVVDESHRSRQNFANTILAKHYNEQALHSRIIALTASPGANKERIDEIRNNLFLDAVEIRTEQDADVQEYLQEKKKIVITVDLPQEFLTIRSLLQNIYQDLLVKLKGVGFSKPLSVVNKTDLLKFQAALQQQIKMKSHSAFYGVSLTAQALKISYALELIETQGLTSLKLFLEKLQTETSKASQFLWKDQRLHDVAQLVLLYLSQNLVHPKLPKLIELVHEELNIDSRAKILVFANYRTTVLELVDALNKAGIRAHKFVGQADRIDKGLKQTEQVELLRAFSFGEYNVLVGSSVSEEGIDISEVSAVVFYESVGSELRSIQRAGRTGRTKAGKVIHLLTKGTRDEYLYFASLRKQNKMKKMLYTLKDKQASFGDFS